MGKYIKFPAYWHGETEKRTLFSCLGFLSSLLFVKLFKIYRPVHSLAIRTVRVGLERETACFPAGIPLSGPSAHGEIIIDYFYLKLSRHQSFVQKGIGVKCIDSDYSLTQLFQYFQAFGFNVSTYYIIILFCIFNII